MAEQSASDRYVRQIREEMLNEFAPVLKEEEVLRVVNQGLTRISHTATVMDYVGVLLKRSSRAELRRLATSRDLDLRKESRPSASETFTGAGLRGVR
jgi:hypothetical protein